MLLLNTLKINLYIIKLLIFYRFNTINVVDTQSGNRTAAEAGERRIYLTMKLQKALETTAPLLREIMNDFRAFLQKTLLGTHAQEIMNDSKGESF